MKNSKPCHGVKGKILVIVFGLLFAVNSHSQTQALKQLELDIEKLAQLKSMLNNMYSGYTILSNGYDNIKNQSLASFTLHKNFIDALSQVSPAVKNAPSISAIVSIQAQIVSEYKTTYNTVKSSSSFTAKELDELTNVYNSILSQSSQNLAALQEVITAGKLQMTEADRLLIIESLRSDMEKQLLSLRNFTGQANQMSLLRARLKKDNNSLRNSYGITK